MTHTHIHTHTPIGLSDRSLVLRLSVQLHRTIQMFLAWTKNSCWHVHRRTHLWPEHVTREPPARMWVCPVAHVCVSIRANTPVHADACPGAHMCVFYRATLKVGYPHVPVMLLCPPGEDAPRMQKKRLGGREVTQAFFSIAKSLWRLSPPWTRPHKHMSELEGSITPSFTKNTNTGWKSNEILPEGRLGFMKEK